MVEAVRKSSKGLKTDTSPFRRVDQTRFFAGLQPPFSELMTSSN
jgi:hypothetical protein